MVDMASKQIIPAVVKYTKSLADTVIAVKEAGADASVQASLLADTSKYLAEAKAALTKLTEEIAKASAVGEPKAQAYAYKDGVTPAMEALRAPVDALEMIVDKEMWPMPSYGDLIFEV